jgi:hypothetical protein
MFRPLHWVKGRGSHTMQRQENLPIISDPIKMIPGGVVVVPICSREVLTQPMAHSPILQIPKCNTSVRRQDKHENSKVQREVGKHTSHNRQ